jgi:protein TonB
MSRGRIGAIVIVALLHAVLGYAFITGLAYSVIKQAAQDLKTFDVVEEPPPPEEEPPPPPPDTPQPVQPPQIVSPPPIVRTQTPPQQVQTVRQAPPPVITTTAAPAPPAPRVAPPPPPPLPPPPPPPPPAPSPPRVVEPARAKANLQGLIRSDDYPSSAQEREEQGTVRVRLSIGTNGSVTGCSVVGSSGSRALDSATCRLLQSRAKFTPARDNQGNPIADSDTVSISWRLEG